MLKWLAEFDPKALKTFDCTQLGCHVKQIILCIIGGSKYFKFASLAMHIRTT